MSSVLVRRPCVYRDGECREPSLPGTRHCMRHIMYNVDQQLFTHCTARHPDNTLCRVPVFDVSHELPLCYKHSKTQVGVRPLYTIMCLGLKMSCCLPLPSTIKHFVIILKTMKSVLYIFYLLKSSSSEASVFVTCPKLHRLEKLFAKLYTIYYYLKEYIITL